MKLILKVIVFIIPFQLMAQDNVKLSSQDIVLRANFHQKIMDFPLMFRLSLDKAFQARKQLSSGRNLSDDDLSTIKWALDISYDSIKMQNFLIKNLDSNILISDKEKLSDWFQSDIGKRFISTSRELTEKEFEEMRLWVTRLEKDPQAGKIKILSRLSKAIHYTELNVSSSLVMMAAGMTSMAAVSIPKKEKVYKESFAKVFKTIIGTSADLEKGLAGESLMKLMYKYRDFSIKDVEIITSFWEGRGKSFSDYMYKNSISYLIYGANKMEKKLYKI